MNDKTAIIDAAQKFAAKGLIDKAISEWEKLLKERNDGNIHNTIGDLYLKKGADHEAVKSFNKAAEIFKKDGFYPKAIAIYKKVLNIAPNDVETLIASAKLNADRELTGNAFENYHRAVEIYIKEGSTEKAIMVVDKMLNLASANMSARAKIAYLYFRLGLRERAANEYASIASYYLQENDVEKAKEFFDKTIEYDPANIAALMGLSKLALMNNDHVQAFEALNNALSQAPDNKEVLLAYAGLAIDADRKGDAKKALTHLSEIDPSGIETKRLLGALYLKEGLIEKACTELLPVIDDALDAGNWSEAHGILHNFRGLHTIPVRQRLLRICKAQGDEHTIGNELKELAALYESEGAGEDALQLYKEALGMDPDDKAASEKIRELEIKLGIAQPSVEIVMEETPGEHIKMEAAAISPEEETVPFEENIFAVHADGRDGLVVPEHIASLEIDVMPDNILVNKSDREQALQTAIDDDLHALFSQFEKREEKAVDYEAHYMAGLDLKQKGLLDDAIKEFQIAAQDPVKLQRNSTMLALCYMGGGSYSLAIAEFNKIINTMTPSDSTYLHVKYELANAHMKNNDMGKALELFSEVQAQDPDFKDVTTNVNLLKAQTAPVMEDKPRLKRDRVSYI